MNFPVGKNSDQSSPQIPQLLDAVDTYFECIASCSIDDGECETKCVEILKELD